MQKIERRRVIFSALGGAVICGGFTRLTSSSIVYITFGVVIGLAIGALIELILSGIYWAVRTDQTHQKEILLRRYGLACFWIVSIPIYVAGGFEAQSGLQVWVGHAQAYPTTGVVINIALSAIAVLVLYLIIRPWSFHYSTNRLTFSLIILIGWFFSVVAIISDPRGFQSAQTLWLVLVILSLQIGLILTARGSRSRAA